MKKTITYLCLMALVPSVSYSIGLSKAAKLAIEKHYDFSELEDISYARQKNGYFHKSNYIYKSKVSQEQLEVNSMALTLGLDTLSEKQRRDIEISLIPLILSGSAIKHSPAFAHIFIEILERHEIADDSKFTKEEVLSKVESLKDFIIEEEERAADRQELLREFGL